MILTVDPGIRGSGVSILGEQMRALVRAAYLRNPVTEGFDLDAQIAMAREILDWARPHATPADTVLVVEWMQIYPDQLNKGDPNKSLLPLVGVVAHLSALANWKARHAYRPREWKGTINGDIMTDRIRGRLTSAELTRLEPCPPSLAHNREDAVGIGLKYLGRLERARVYPR